MLLKRWSCGLLQQLDSAAGSGRVLQDILIRYNSNNSMLSGGLDTTVTKTAEGRTLRRKKNNKNHHHHHHHKNKPPLSHHQGEPEHHSVAAQTSGTSVSASTVGGTPPNAAGHPASRQVLGFQEEETNNQELRQQRPVHKEINH